MEDYPPPGGKTFQIQFPHQGYKRVVQQVALFYGTSVNGWLIAVIQAGILAAIEDDENLSALVKGLSSSLWMEVQEKGKE